MPELNQFLDILKRHSIPQEENFSRLLGQTIHTLSNEDKKTRPCNKNKKPGGFVDITQTSPAHTIIVPDLHARDAFVFNLLSTPVSLLGLGENNSEENPGNNVLNSLDNSSIKLVFLGDILHSERRGYERWNMAFKEFSNGNILSSYMEEEMIEGLNTMEMLMLLKVSYPENVHILKGNHENILNSSSGGNFSFYKFAAESTMVTDFMYERYSPDLILSYNTMENLFPLALKGNYFLASHAEPMRPYTKRELINSNLNPETIFGLTWTREGESQPDSPDLMLGEFFPDPQKTLYFAGHRTIKQEYILRENSRFIQIHNPDYYQVGVIPKNGLPPINKLIRRIKQ